MLRFTVNPPLILRGGAFGVIIEDSVPSYYLRSSDGSMQTQKPLSHFVYLKRYLCAFIKKKVFHSKS